MTPAQTRDALVRVTKFVDEYQKMRGLHPDNIHSLHFGMEHGATLTVSDLRALLAALPVAGDAEPVAWRPRYVEPCATFNAGVPSQKSIDYYNEHANGIEYAYAAPPPAAVPAGFVLVPVEPTEEMLRDATNAYMTADSRAGAPERAMWKAMLAAAPKVTR